MNDYVKLFILLASFAGGLLISLMLCGICLLVSPIICLGLAFLAGNTIYENVVKEYNKQKKNQSSQTIIDADFTEID